VKIFYGLSHYSARFYLKTWKHIKILAAIALGKICDRNAASSLITALLSDQDKNVEREVAKALNTIVKDNTLEQTNILERLLLLSGSNIYKSEKSEVFFLARSWAIRFSKSGSSFIPIYPELIQTSATADKAEK
jgi:HEAT repeat protein